MRLPTSNEINPFNDLDGRTAERHFLGKNLDEAETLFRESSLYYQEDLMFMGVVAFRFYVEAAIRYIKSESSTGNSDIISCLAGTLEFRLEHEAKQLVSIAQLLASACRYVIENYGRFNAESEIYGDLRSRFATLQKSFQNLAELAPS